MNTPLSGLYYYPRQPQRKPYWLWLALVVIMLLLLLRQAKGEIAPLSIAQSQIGNSEIGGNNRGPWVKRYMGGREGILQGSALEGSPWCAGFISYCFYKAGYKLPYFLKAKSYLKAGLKIERQNLKPGDLIIFNRKGGGHIGIIERISKDKIITIEGNKGKFPSKIQRYEYNLNNIPNLSAFVRLRKK